MHVLEALLDSTEDGLEYDDAFPFDGGDEMPVLGGEAGSGVDGNVVAAEDTGRAAPHWVDRRIVGNRDVDPEVVAEVAGAAEPDGCGVPVNVVRGSPKLARTGCA